MKKYIAILLAVICAFSTIACSYQKQLTIDDVVALSGKGEELSWYDFEQYESVDVGSGIYVFVYEIDETFELRIGGVPDEVPFYIRLVTKVNTDNYIDIRTDDINAFIEANKK